MPRTGSEMINVLLSLVLVDDLDAAAAAERTTRKVIVTRALAKAGYRVPAHDLGQNAAQTPPDHAGWPEPGGMSGSKPLRPKRRREAATADFTKMIADAREKVAKAGYYARVVEHAIAA